MLHIILYQPEIPPNTGNIIRLCANTGAKLHLVEPLGFQLDDTRVKRAGLDYHELVQVKRYRNWPAFRKQNPDLRLWSFSTSGRKYHNQANYIMGDGLLFGPETRGLPESVLLEVGLDHCVRLPMFQDSRSLNLSNTVAVALFEAWRQLDFNGASAN